MNKSKRDKQKEVEIINTNSENVNSNEQYANSKLVIEVKRHQQLFDLLSDPKRMWRVLLSLFVVISVIFLGFASVIIAIKKYYPYNIIETNLQGASIMKTEDKEVIYWLFNSADLWANSGIGVKEGDVLTIRASGASFTAIHHLVDASEKNYSPTDEWVGTEGQKMDKSNVRDVLRSAYRINKNYDEGILLMQIVPNDSIIEMDGKMTASPNCLDNGYIEVIGKERINLLVSQEGVLHFAVNDIVLSDNVINSMYNQWIDSLESRHFVINGEKGKDDVMKSFERIDLKRLKDLNNLMFNRQKIDSLKKMQIGLALGRYPIIKGDSSFHNAYPFINELVYYKEKGFRDAWYVDNLGSFLIVIERKKTN